MLNLAQNGTSREDVEVALQFFNNDKTTDYDRLRPIKPRTMSAEEFLKLYRPVEEYEDDVDIVIGTKDGTFHSVTQIMESYAREYHAKEMERVFDKPPFNDFYALAEWMHYNYEQISLKKGWKTQDNCQVSFEELPNENKEVMLEISLRLLTHLKTKIKE